MEIAFRGIYHGRRIACSPEDAIMTRLVQFQRKYGDEAGAVIYRLLQIIAGRSPRIPTGPKRPRRR